MKGRVHSESVMVRAVKELESGVKSDQTWHSAQDLVQMENPIWRYGVESGEAFQGVGGREPQAQSDVTWHLKPDTA